jgi:hypothetical protein
MRIPVIAKEARMLTREDLTNLHEFIHQARLLGLEERILGRMDLSDPAWQETVDRLEATGGPR